MRTSVAIAAALGAGALAFIATRAFARSSDEDVGTIDAPDTLDTIRETIDGITGAGDMTPSEQRNMNAFLAMIRAAEGTSGPNGYRTLFGGGLFQSFDDHPRVRFYGEFLQKGKQTYTTAAGAYQITESTYDRVADKLDLQDFSPASQDAIAIELIREKHAVDDVVAGQFDAAIDKVAPVWASLPASTRPQPKRTVQFVRAAYERAGGQYV
jgi:muramidase (phage lysozyme)